jgi:hypothetical protein
VVLSRDCLDIRLYWDGNIFGAMGNLMKALVYTIITAILIIVAYPIDADTLGHAKTDAIQQVIEK